MEQMRRDEPNLSSTTKADCKRCNDTGWIIANGSARPCPCQEQKWQKDKQERLFRSARIPRRYMSKTFANFDSQRQPAAHKAARAFVDDWEHNLESGSSLFLVGDVGTGKTHLAFGILHALLEKKVSGMAANVPALMDDLRPSSHADGEEQMAALKTVPLLVLDDLGAQRTTEWVTERLYVLLNARYDNYLPTVITSNDYLEDLAKMHGWRRIVDRIVEMCDLIRVEGESYRRRQR